MKLMIVNSAYPTFLAQLYSEHGDLAGKTYDEQRQALLNEVYDWSNHWSSALKPLGYEVREHMINASLMQRAWGHEHGVDVASATWLEDILVSQAKVFNPDILWYDSLDTALLKRLKAGLPSLRFVLGWVGSAIAKTDVWSEMDLILSCAPESVEALARSGYRTAHLHHAFSPTVLERIQPDPGKYMLSFIGQILRGSQFHIEREKLLLSLLREVDLSIFSPSATMALLSPSALMARKGLYRGIQLLRNLGLNEELLKFPLLAKAAQWSSPPVQPVDPALRKRMLPPVFGRRMYEVIAASQMTLNIHADSSPRFVSNMRLFESTGVGSCQLVDWRPNLPELFTPDKEVVTYRSAEECAEKVRWLRDHPNEREGIARAGQRRCLRDHTFANRGTELDRLIRHSL